MSMDRPEDQGSRRVPHDGGQDGRTYKEFFLTSFAVDHRTSILVLLFIVTFGGIGAYLSIPKEAAPEIEIPIIAVNTIYPGVSPADMESLVTRVLEEDLNTIPDVKEMRSSSVEGYSSITVEFETSVNLEDALQRVREKVDLAKPDLPQDAEDPAIVEFNMADMPIMQVNVAGEYGLVRLKEIGEEMQDRMEQIPTVLRVDLRGGLEREVKVDIDLAKLKFYNLGFWDVVETIQQENVNIPGGSIDVGDVKYLVRVDGEFVDPSLIEDLVIKTEGGNPIYVRDVASVEFGFAERESYARLNGNPVVTLDVVKRSGENIIETADAVKAIIADMEGFFPPTTVVTITGDQSDDIFEMVSSLENNIISALILIVAVLFFFLGVRTSSFVALAIPTSMLLSFLVLGLLGVTMNMVVLFSLILALGMLVDNAIVIVENMYRFLEEGWDRIDAAKKATGEVAMPVIASTATTLAAFAPLMFWPGITGEFMKYLPLTLIVTLASSLFVALVIVPTVASMFMRVDGQKAPPMRPAMRYTLIGVTVLATLIVASVNPLTAGLLVATFAVSYVIHVNVLSKVARRFQDDLLPATINIYESQLRWALGHRAVMVAGSAVVLVATFIAFGFLNNGVEFFPEDIPPSAVTIDWEAPVGTRVQATDRMAYRILQEIEGVEGLGDVESEVATVGGGGGANPMGGGASGPQAGRFTMTFVEFKDREHDGFRTLADLQGRVGTTIAGATFKVDKPVEGPPTGKPVNMELVGEDPLLLKRLSDEVLAVLRGAPVFPKLVGLESDLDEARPELSVHVDREKAALYGVSTLDVGNAVRGAINGLEAAKYRTGNDEYDIIVRLRPEDRSELNALADLTVMNEGTQVPLLSVASWTVQDGYGSINRVDMDKVATISSDVAAGYNQNAVLAEVQATLDPFIATLPPGYTVRFTGSSQEQAEAQAFLSTAFLMALALIGFILVSQFNSVVKPVIILTSVIMSTVGVLMGYMVFQMPFVVIMTGVGIISLAGIVVNNAIVLIDYIDILRERDGMDRREALVEGGKTRFRPVILTAITTALGLVPLAVGLNFDFFGLYTNLNPELYWGGDQAAWWGPMAIAVICGIVFATFLTLVLVPIMYSLVDDFSDFFARNFSPIEVEAEGAARLDEPFIPPREITEVPEPEPEVAGDRVAAAAYRENAPFGTGLRTQPGSD
jgi:multidrug efflux pump subunit AcrB